MLPSQPGSGENGSKSLGLSVACPLEANVYDRNRRKFSLKRSSNWSE